MGYTHYWKLSEPISQENFSKITSGVLQIVATAQSAGINLEATFEPNEFIINGVGENRHESFYMNTEKEGFNFCKTAFKPYDAVVTASLIYAKTILGDDIKITSDGNWVDWQDGSILYEEVFGIEPLEVLGGGLNEARLESHKRWMRDWEEGLAYCHNCDSEYTDSQVLKRDDENLCPRCENPEEKTYYYCKEHGSNDDDCERTNG